MRPKNQTSMSIFLVCISLALASINFSYGYFEDVDVVEIIKRSWKFPTQGWGPSRSWGFPIYELFLYPTIHYFGLTGAKIESVIFYILSGLLLFKLLFYLTKDFFTSFLGSLSLIVHPISIATSSVIVATSQEIFLSLLALYFFFKYFYEGKWFYLFSMILFCGLATATRQDYFMLGLSLATTLLFFKKLRGKSFLLSIFLYALVVIGPYLLFYGIGHFSNVSTEFMSNDRFLRKFFRAILGYMAIFGLPVLSLAFVFIIKRRPSLKESKEWVLKNPAAFLFFSSLFLYFIRFTMLADKLEYVWVLFPLLIILVAISFKNRAILILFLIATFLPNVLQIHLFQRVGSAIQLDIGFSPGAIAQERSGRLKNQYRFFGDYETTIARVVREKFGCKDHIWYLADLPGRDYCIAVPEEMLRFWNPDRLQEGVDRKKLLDRKIIVFDFPDNRGWRQFMKFKPWKPLNPEDFRLFASK